MKIGAVEHYFMTARERYSIKVRRSTGMPPPWTEDPIFQTWRFCNVHREDDKTTIWFREQVRSKLAGYRLAEATLAFRWFNRIETGELILDLLLKGWDAEEARRRFVGVYPLVTGAYIVNTRATPMVGLSKSDGVLLAIEGARRGLPELVPQWGTSLREAAESLQRFVCLGGFMAYEIVSDLRWTHLLKNAEDINTWAHLGVGATRGMGWLVHGDPKAFRHMNGRDQFVMLHNAKYLLDQSRNPILWPHEWPRWEMREVEHWLCEYDKYRRAGRGERMKRRFDDGITRT